MSRVKLSEAIYRLLLRLYPREFRDRFGNQMVWVFRDRLAVALIRGRSWPLARAWWFVIGDLFSSVTAEHRAVWKERMRGHQVGVGGDGPDRRKRRGGSRRRAYLQEAIQDTRFGLRQLLRRPAFTVLVLITLAVGIGATTAVFSVIRGVLLLPLPYPDSDRLAFVESAGSEGGTGPTSGPDFLDWRELNRSFESLAASLSGPVNLTGTGEPERLVGAQVSGHMFEVFDVRPALGRPILASDEGPSASNVVVLSDGFWRRRFGRDAAVLGTGIVLNGETYSVVGIMPPRFNMPVPWSSYDVWRPLPSAALEEERGWRRMWVVGRLADHVSIEAASTDLARVANALAEQYPQTNTGQGVRIVPLKTAFVGYTSGPLLLLFGASGLVLLIVCANIAGLVTARSSTRRTEVAIRSALGASRGRLVRQLLTESLLLSLLGGVSGLVLAQLSIGSFTTLIPVGIPRVDEIRIDWWVLGFTGAASLATAVAVGLFPALSSSRSNLSKALREGKAISRSGPSGNRIRGAFIVAQVALTVLLANGAALMLKSYLKLRNLDQGFNPSNVLTLTVLPQGPKYAEPEQRFEFYREIIGRVRGLPGVKQASAISKLPLEGGSNTKVMVQGREAEFDENRAPLIELSRIFPGYIETMDIPLLSGRDIQDDDFSIGAPGILINRVMAEQLWPNESPIGKRVSWEIEEPQWLTVVGVVGGTRQWGIEYEPVPEMLIPYTVLPRPRMFLTVRTASDPMSHVNAIRRVVNFVDNSLPVSGIRTMEQVLESSVAGRRFNTFLISVFSTIALILVVAGIYGVISYYAAESTHEIGIRMALGAAGGRVMGEFLLRGLRLAAMGIFLGLGAVIASNKITSSILYEVSPTDPQMLVIGTIVIVLLAMIASFVPARRAAKVSPTTALQMKL